MDAEIRDLRADDRQAVRRLRFRTFSDEDFEPDEDEAYIEDERRVVAELDGQVVGHAGAWRFGQFFGGRRVPMAAVAAVLVEPHARGTGVASAMLRRLVDRVVERGDAIATLYPATAVPYRRLGWELAGDLPAHTLPTRALLTVGPPSTEVDLRPGVRADLDAMQRCYLEVARHRPGWFAPDERYLGYGDEPIDHGGARELWVAERDGALTGYTIYERESGTDGWRGNRLRLVELIALDSDTERALWRVVGGSWSVWPTLAIRGGAAMTPLHLLREDELRADPDRWSRWMLRLLDLPGAFAARGFAGAGQATVHLDVHDAWLPTNHGRWVLEIADGNATVEPGGDGTVRIDVGALSSLYAGYTPASTWQRLGRLVSEDAAAVATLDAVLAGPAPTAAHYF